MVQDYSIVRASDRWAKQKGGVMALPIISSNSLAVLRMSASHFFASLCDLVAITEESDSPLSSFFRRKEPSRGISNQSFYSKWSRPSQAHWTSQCALWWAKQKVWNADERVDDIFYYALRITFSFFLSLSFLWLSNRGAAFSCKSSPACVVLRRGFLNGAFWVGASSGVTKTRICCFAPALISMPLDCPAAALGICVSHSLTKPAVLGEPRLRGRDRKEKRLRGSVLFS